MFLVKASQKPSQVVLRLEIMWSKSTEKSKALLQTLNNLVQLLY